MNFIFLAAACADRAATRAAVERMLACCSQVDDFFVQTSQALAPAIEAIQTVAREQTFYEVDGVTAAFEDAVGQQIGSYKVLEKIGEGGCGVV
jgi:hypothetical protein